MANEVWCNHCGQPVSPQGQYGHLKMSHGIDAKGKELQDHFSSQDPARVEPKVVKTVKSDELTKDDLLAGAHAISAEKENRCGQCKYEFDGQPESCPSCGGKFEWE